MSPDLAAQIRSHRPSGAKAYFLWQFDQRFPSSGGFSLEPISLPFGLPVGDYRIGFLADANSNQMLAPNNPSNPNPTISITVEGGAALALGKSGPPPEKPPKTATPFDPLLSDPEHLRHRVEFEAIRMADQTVKNKALLPRAGMRTREIGEGFVLTRAYRQEHEQLMRTMSVMQRETMELARKSLTFANEAADRMMEAGRQVPPPPPDHLTPVMNFFTTAVTTLGEVVHGRKSKNRPGDPIMDALVGADSESDSKPDSDELRAARAELAETKKQLEKQKRDLANARGQKPAAVPPSNPQRERRKPDKKRRSGTPPDSNDAVESGPRPATSNEAKEAESPNQRSDNPPPALPAKGETK